MNVPRVFKRFWGRGDGLAPFTGPDRRMAERYESAPNHARLSWHDGATEQSAEARLENFGTKGALVVTTAIPPAGARVYFRLEVPEPTDWVEVDFVRAAGPNRIALRFLGACPYELFKSARGIVERACDPSASASEYDSRAWR